LTGLTTYSSNWDKQFSITGLVIPGSNYQFYVDNNDVAGLKAFALRGNDAITGSHFNDVLWGYAGDDILDGDLGNDTLDGGDGNDILDGRTGNDVLNGGNGNDSAYYNSATAGVTLNLWNTGLQNTVNAGFDTLTNIENLLGSNYNDILAGNAAANNLNGSKGDDKLTGGAGNDLLNGGDGNCQCSCRLDG